MVHRMYILREIPKLHFSRWYTAATLTFRLSRSSRYSPVPQILAEKLLVLSPVTEILSTTSTFRYSSPLSPSGLYSLVPYPTTLRGLTPLVTHSSARCRLRLVVSALTSTTVCGSRSGMSLPRLPRSRMVTTT
mgnify:CR=1 FL=1